MRIAVEAYVGSTLDRPSRSELAENGTRPAGAGLVPHLPGSPYGIRTRAATLRGWCPRPLDERAKLRRPTLPPGDVNRTSRLVGVQGIEP